MMARNDRKCAAERHSSGPSATHVLNPNIRFIELTFAKS